MVQQTSPSINEVNRLRAIIESLHEALHADGLKEVLTAVIQGIRRVVGAEATAAITLVDGMGRLDENTYCIEGPLAAVLRKEAPRPDGISAWVVKNRKAVFEENIAEGEDPTHPRLRQTRARAGAYACLLLASRERAVGTLFVMFQRPFRFTDEIKAALESFVALAGHAVDLARSNERQVELVQRISQQLVATWQERDPAATLRATLDQVLDEVQREVFTDEEVSAAIYIYEKDEGFHNGIARGPLHEYLQHALSGLSDHLGVALHAVQQKKPLFVEDVSSLPEGVPRPAAEAIEAGARAFASLPLTITDTVVGVLVIALPRPYRYDEEKREILRLFAARAAIALQAARVHRRRLREQLALQRIAEAISSGSFERAADIIAQQAVELTGASYATFWAADEQHQQLRLAGQYQLLQEWIPPNSVLPIDDRSINGHVFRTRKEHYAPDLDKDPYHFPFDIAARSAYCVPLSVGEGEERRWIGTLYVASERVDALSAEQQAFIKSLAPHAAVALYSARLLEEEKTQRQAAEAFQRIVADVHSKTDLQSIGQAILAQLQKVVPFRTASLQLIYGDQRRLFAASGFDIETADPKLTRPISEDRTVSAIVSLRKLRIIPHANWPDLPAVKSWCGVPLVVDNKVLGLLTLDHDEPGFYSENAHRGLLESFANHAALALRDAQRTRNLDTLNKFALKISSIQDEQSLYRTVVDAVVNTLDCSYCTVFLVGPDGRLAPVPEGCGGKLFARVPEITFAPGEGIAGHVFQTGRPALVLDTSDDDRYVPGPSELSVRPRSLLTVPLRKGEAVIGVISADFDRTDAFGQDDQRLLETIAAYANIALQNIESRRDLQVLHDAAVDLTKQPDLQHIYEVAVKNTAEAVHCSHSTLFIYERKTGELIPVERVDGTAPASAARRFRRGEGLAGYVFETGIALNVPDASQDSRFVEGNVTRKDQPRSVILAPVRANGEKIGVLTADKDVTHGFTDRNLRTLETLALDVGIAIKARRLQDRLEAVTRFQRAIGDLLNLPDQLTQIYDELSRHIDTSGLFIGLYQAESNTIEFPLVYENGKKISDELKVGRNPYAPRKFGDPSGLTEWVIKREKPLLIEDVDQWTEGREEVAPELLVGLKSCVVVPMIAEERVIGAIGLQNFDQPSAFSEDDRDFLTAIANSAAVAIENAKKYDLINNQLDRQIKALRAVSRFQEEISAIGSFEKELEEIYSKAVEVLHEVVPTEYLTIAIYDKDQDTISFPVAYSAGRKVTEEEKQAGKTYGPRRYSTDRGLTRYVIEHHDKGPLLIAGEFKKWLDEHANEVSLLPGEDTACWLGAPMVLGDKVLGAIVLQHPVRENVFDELHKTLIATVASQAAIALDNAQQYDLIENTLKRRIKELEAIKGLQERLSAIVPIEQQLDNIYTSTAKAMADLMDTSNMYIALYDPDKQLIEFVLWYENGVRMPREAMASKEHLRPRRLGDRNGLTEWVINHKEPLLVPREFARWAESQPDVEVFDIGTKCWLGAPMLLRGKVVGVIGLQNFEREEVFDEKHRDLLFTIASMAAIAIDNARQYDRVQALLDRRSRELRAVGKFQEEITRLDVAEEPI